MKRLLPIVAGLLVVALAIAAEILQENAPKERMPVAEEASTGIHREVPMDRMPWELAEPRLSPWRVWWDEPHIPPDHPFWWTLTDEITPQQLKQRLEGRRASEEAEFRAKLRRATGEARNELNFMWTLSGREHPELLPLWTTFDVFARNVGEGRQDESQRLVEFGLSPEVVEAAVAAAEEVLASDLSREIGQAQEQMHQLYERAREQIGPEAVEELRSRNDFARLSELVGWSQDALRELALRARRHWPAEESIPPMVSLRREIGEEQWERFRRFLLVEVAPGIAQGFFLDEAARAQHPQPR